MSAIARFDYNKKEISVYAKIYFYGKYAEPVLAQKIVNEINDFWNTPKAELIVDYIPMQVKFQVDYECLGIVDVKLSMKSNGSHVNNYVRLEDKNVSERSMMGYGMGENSGHWIISDNLGDSTTAAHEFGHAYGLPHPERLDYRNFGIPPIMAPRGTLVDAMYQWNPLVDAGEYGGTMRPIHRRVSVYEIFDIFENIPAGKPDSWNIGKVTNYFFDEIGNRD